ncbi:MAG TPA: DUF3618 domain-containing protein [Baekduia sp.]|nr:DUF3618 domain-containing protein [Baekduia sp.]
MSDRRTSAEIRRSMEENTRELSTAIASLRGQVEELVDWRKQARAHQKELAIGVGGIGVALGIAIAVSRIFRRR